MVKLPLPASIIPTFTVFLFSTSTNPSKPLQSSSSFFKASHNVWFRAVSVLVRQKFERSDQVFTQPLRRRIRPVDFCLTNERACRQDHDLVGFFQLVRFPAYRAPPACQSLPMLFGKELKVVL